MKLPRDLSGPQVIKALGRLGFKFQRQVGSHVRLSNGNVHITVPMHDALLPKTLKSILNQADITIEQLMEEI